MNYEDGSRWKFNHTSFFIMDRTKQKTLYLAGNKYVIKKIQFKKADGHSQSSSFFVQHAIDENRCKSTN